LSIQSDRINVTYSTLKNKINKTKHGISLRRAKDLDMSTARLALDDREDHGEDRWVAIGFLDARLYVLVFTFTELGIRAISLRRAERYEEAIYAEE
jgi:uncharacterized DUF497 family protein